MKSCRASKMQNSKKSKSRWRMQQQQQRLTSSRAGERAECAGQRARSMQPAWRERQSWLATRGLDGSKTGRRARLSRKCKDSGKTAKKAANASAIVVGHKSGLQRPDSQSGPAWVVSEKMPKHNRHSPHVIQRARSVVSTSHCRSPARVLCTKGAVATATQSKPRSRRIGRP